MKKNEMFLEDVKSGEIIEVISSPLRCNFEEGEQFIVVHSKYVPDCGINYFDDGSNVFRIRSRSLWRLPFHTIVKKAIEDERI